MEELKKELEKLSKAYVDTPENEEKILIPFLKFIYKPKFFNYECNLVHYHWNCCRIFGP